MKINKETKHLKKYKINIKLSQIPFLDSSLEGLSDFYWKII
jgi:hypothetical protein